MTGERRGRRERKKSFFFVKKKVHVFHFSMASSLPSRFASRFLSLSSRSFPGLVRLARADQHGAQTTQWKRGGGGRGGRGRGGRSSSGRGRGRGRPPPPPPDHFVSLRVPSDIAAPFFDAAHASLRGYAGGVLEPYLVGRETAHVTLAVVRLNESSSGEGGGGGWRRGGDGGRGGGGGGEEDEKEEEREPAGAAAEVAASRNAASWKQQQRRDPLKVEAATRALVAAAASISEALLEVEREAGEGGGNGDDEAAKATTSVASALLSNLRLEPELGTFSQGRVLWLKPDDGFGGRALAAAERAVARALEAEAAVLLGAGADGGGSGGRPSSSRPAKPFNPHITVAKVPWSPRTRWRHSPGAAGKTASASSSPRGPRPPPTSIPVEAHAGALEGLPRSALFGAPELELCRIGSSSEGQYYEVVATAKISVAAAVKEEGGGGG